MPKKKWYSHTSFIRTPKNWNPLLSDTKLQEIDFSMHFTHLFGNFQVRLQQILPSFQIKRKTR